MEVIDEFAALSGTAKIKFRCSALAATAPPPHYFCYTDSHGLRMLRIKGAILMLMAGERRQIADYGRRMSDAGLSCGTSGNLSVYDAKSGYMAISPSGMGYSEINAEDVVVMTLDGKIADGKRKPSSEHGLHAAFYINKPEARAVIHTHSTYCTVLACLRMPLKAVHYAIAAAGTAEIPCAEYATFGTPELAANAIKACGGGKAVLLASHGLVAWESSLERAFDLAVNLEFTAEILWRAMCVGKPAILNETEMADVMRGFDAYGQTREDGKTRRAGY